MNYLIVDENEKKDDEQAPAAAAPAPQQPASDDGWLDGDDSDPFADGDDLLGDGAADQLAADEPILLDPEPAAQAPAPAPAPVRAQAPAPAAPAPDQFNVQAPTLEHLSPAVQTVGGVPQDLSTLVLDVEVPVEVFFGDAALTVEEFLELGAGSVVELDHEIAAPVELRVRGKVVALGQLITIGGKYGLRITEMRDNS